MHYLAWFKNNSIGFFSITIGNIYLKLISFLLIGVYYLLPIPALPNPGALSCDTHADEFNEGEYICDLKLRPRSCCTGGDGDEELFQSEFSFLWYPDPIAEVRY